MRQASVVVYCAIDPFVPTKGKIHPGFEQFSVALDVAGIPAIWLTSRTRAQIDDPRRKLGHKHPFIAEWGSGVYLPEDYFHLRPDRTVRLGRFTCIPIGELQPAAAEALETISDETSVPAVPLRSLSPRELAQNSGLPPREAELARLRDFDELFFFAGASDENIDRFRVEVQRRKLQLRSQGIFWSLAVGANVAHSVRELAKLYDRALHSHATIIGIATPDYSTELFPACDRSVLLRDSVPPSLASEPQSFHRTREFSLQASDVWDRVLTSIVAKP